MASCEVPPQSRVPSHAFATTRGLRRRLVAGVCTATTAGRGLWPDPRGLVSRIGADAATARGLPSPCGHRLLGLAVRRGSLNLRRYSSRTEEQGGRRRWCQRERERVRKEAGGSKCGCQTLASVHPLFYMRASTL